MKKHNVFAWHNETLLCGECAWPLQPDMTYKHVRGHAWERRLKCENRGCSRQGIMYRASTEHVKLERVDG